MRKPKCLCTRCQKYQHNLADYDYNEGQKTVVFEDRPYQNTLIEIAKRRNIIACLPTGSGKTYIALKLMDHFKDKIFEKGKKVFFLANTIPLVNQQAAFFARNSEFAVKHITGDMECDYWSDEKWKEIINGYNVIAMTAQIFLNIVRSGIVAFSDAQLIIFDECHHAANEHPMRNIMKEYEYVLKKKPLDYEMPRILGLTATIIKGNCKTHEVPERVRELEGTMQSTAVTYKDYEEVLRCSTSARIVKESTSFDACSGWELYLDQLKQFSSELNEFRKRRKKAIAKAEEAVKNGIHPSLISADNIYLGLRTATPGDLKIAVDDVRSTLEQLGTYCGVIALSLRLAFIDFSLMDLNDGELKTWYLKIKSFFTDMREDFKRHLERAFEPLDVISPKLQSLVKLMDENFRNLGGNSQCGCDDDDAGICGLIFTDRRVTAQVLAWYLRDLAEKEKFKFIKANFVVGSSRSPFETVESRIYAKKQTDTINKFRNKEYNILVATSVLEEGIDVPSCNLVIRFDTIRSYTSYIQSMGRARKKGAIFYALLNSVKFSKESADLDTYQEINRAMVKHLVQNVEKVDEEDKDLSSYNIKGHDIEPFCPGDKPDSPRITLESASEIVERYCMLLPCDGIATLNKLCWWEQVPQQGFRAHLRLPMNGVIRETISSDIAPNKEFANALVHFKAAILLYEHKSLDDHLVPVRPSFPDKLEAFFNFHIPLAKLETENGAEEDDSPSSSKKPKLKEPNKLKKDWYPKTMSKVLGDAPLLLEDRKYDVYRICFELKKNEAYPWRNLYELSDSQFAFGMILSSKLPNVRSFPLYGGFGAITVTLQKIPQFQIQWSRDNRHRLLEFQRIIFGDVLHLKHDLLRGASNVSFAIIPLTKEYRSGKWTLDENVLSDINAFFSIEKTKRPNAESRRREANKEWNLHPSQRKDYNRKFRGRVVVPWYKGNKDKILYLVDHVDAEMSPLSRQGEFDTYKKFYQEQYKTEVFNLGQPLLKCKIAGIGKGTKSKQMNYLLEKFAKEDHFPVYLIPELCHILPLSASCITQLKFLPSILHRLNRLLLSRQLLCDIGFTADYPNDDETHSLQLERLCNLHREKREKEEDMRLERETARQLQRESARQKYRMQEKDIPEKKKIEDRELHYEFIHPNDITPKHVKDLHAAVSDQHAAKKLTFQEQVQELEEGELVEVSKIELLPFEDLNPRTIEPKKVDESASIDTFGPIGPSLLSMMEGLTRHRASDGISYDRVAMLGRAFLNFAVSRYTYLNFQDWNEPLMCQLRNRLLSTQYLNMVARKRNLPDILAGSDFYPSEHWVPPGFRLLDKVGEVAAANKVHLGVYNNVLDKIKDMRFEQLENYTKFHGPELKQSDEQKQTAKANPREISGKTKFVPPFTKFSAYTYAEINDMEIADVLCGVIGVCFRDCGSRASYKALNWLGFVVPDIKGEDLNLDNNPGLKDKLLDDEAVKKLVPTLAAFEEKIGYSFRDKSLFVEAVTHPSYLGNKVSDCYQRIQFLGDAILELLITTHLFTLPTKHKMSELQIIRSALVNKVTYASLTVRYGLQKYLLSLSKSLTDMIDNFVVFQETVEHHVIGHFTLITDEECNGPKHIEVPKVLGDIFEALAGAIYLDSGSLDTVWKIFYRLMQNEIDTFTENVPKSPTQELTENKMLKDKVQFTKWTSAKLRARGKEMMKIDVGPYGHYYGVGTTYNRAKEAAAKLALKMIKEDDEFMEGRDDNHTILLMV